MLNLEKLTEICNECLITVVTNSSYNLSYLKRNEIYFYLKPSRLLNINQEISDVDFSYEKFRSRMLEEINKFTFADHVINWIAILTAQKLDKIWDKISEYHDFNLQLGLTFSHTLMAAKSFLAGLIEYDEAYNQLDTAYWVIEEISDNVPFDVLSALKTAYAALSFILNGPLNRPVDEHKEFDYFIHHTLDTLDNIDVNQMKKSTELDFQRLLSTLEKIDEGSILDFNDVNKKVNLHNMIDRLEFWRWWLTEAVPQAWQLAHSTFGHKPSV